MLRTNPVIFRTNTVIFRTNALNLRTTWDRNCDCNRQKRTEKDRKRQQRTKIERNGKKRTETDRYIQFCQVKPSLANISRAFQSLESLANFSHV